MKITIIGAGTMGSWFANLLKEEGKVTLCDIERKIADDAASRLGVSSAPQHEAVRSADIILVAVPISETPRVVRSALGFMKTGALLVDISSVKSEVVEVMKEFKGRIELASVHPLFGPGATTLRGKDVISVPVKTGRWYRWLKQFMVKNGATFTEMDAEEHDRLMSVIQSLTHFTLISYLASASTLKEYCKTGKIRTPIFEELRELAKCLLRGDLKMYGEIQVHNRYSRIIRSHFIEACRSLDLAFSSGDFRSTPEFLKRAMKMFDRSELEKSYRELYRRFEGRKR
ncbi:MAG: prephenate dehydrogenase/arogenate dehydrogenase family protein [Candidatus Hadarchaeales archaeon]